MNTHATHLPKPPKPIWQTMPVEKAIDAFSARDWLACMDDDQLVAVWNQQHQFMSRPVVEFDAEAACAVRALIEEQIVTRFIKRNGCKLRRAA